MLLENPWDRRRSFALTTGKIPSIYEVLSLLLFFCLFFVFMPRALKCQNNLSKRVLTSCMMLLLLLLLLLIQWLDNNRNNSTALNQFN
jgi:hypothetical protein